MFLIAFALSFFTFVSIYTMKQTIIGQTALLRNAAPILASKSLAQAAADIKQRGFCRVDSVLSPESALQLKLHINELRRSSVDSETQKWSMWLGALEKRYIPGTRLRLGGGVQVLPMTSKRDRNDVLLPLDDDVVANALRVAATALADVLREGSDCLPEVVAVTVTDTDAIDLELELELVTSADTAFLNAAKVAVGNAVKSAALSSTLVGTTNGASEIGTYASAAFDIFLSYRVKADVAHAEYLYKLLTARGLKVWWDKKVSCERF
jgi:hypothetical protein